MKVTINANTVGNMLNADVINLGQLQSLGERDRARLIDELIRTLKERTTALAKDPHAVSSEQMKSLGEELSKAAASLAKEAPDPESTRKQAHTVLENIRSSFGSVADIVLNAVKLAQVAGIFTGHVV